MSNQTRKAKKVPPEVQTPDTPEKSKRRIGHPSASDSSRLAKNAETDWLDINDPELKDIFEGRFTTTEMEKFSESAYAALVQYEHCADLSRTASGHAAKRGFDRGQVNIDLRAIVLSYLVLPASDRQRILKVTSRPDSKAAYFKTLAELANSWTWTRLLSPDPQKLPEKAPPPFQCKMELDALSRSILALGRGRFDRFLFDCFKRWRDDESWRMNILLIQAVNAVKSREPLAVATWLDSTGLLTLPPKAERAKVTEGVSIGDNRETQKALEKYRRRQEQSLKREKHLTMIRQRLARL